MPGLMIGMGSESLVVFVDVVLDAIGLREEDNKVERLVAPAAVNPADCCVS